MLFARLATLLSLTLAVVTPVLTNPVAVSPRVTVTSGEGLQDLVTWDEYSFYVRGERLVFYSGEFHPYRLPSPDLSLDVFQKIKSLGYNGVSFYLNWALLEGEEGVYRAAGVFALEPFFEAAAEAGIYLLARPGPYINAEVSGGGFPGWLTRLNSTYRTNDTFLQATDLYMKSVGATIAKYQITNGGPIALIQPENEYTNPANNITFPNNQYFKYIIDQIRNASIVIPTISNDASPKGIFSPDNATYTTHVDVYGHDSYPQGFNCEQPYNWTPNAIPTTFWTLHEQQSPSTPYSIVEFQGGSFDPWGGYGFEQCAALTNEQFERIFYKNNWSFRVTFFNIYMTYGGTNWGNLGHPLGYTSYDYGSPISEDRSVTRAKYSETKLGANFIKVTPAYITSSPSNYTNGTYASSQDIAVTRLSGNGTDGDLYVVRHAAYNSYASTAYTFTVPTSAGNITIPQLNNFSDHLTLNGRDSKVHVTDYSLNGINLLYSSGEIFTWQKYANKTSLVLYGDSNETHEFAVPASEQCRLAPGSEASIALASQNGYNVVQWGVLPQTRVVECESLTVHLVWRHEVYNWWALEMEEPSPTANYSSAGKTSVVVSGGYLMRSAKLQNGDLYLTGDLNATTTIDVLGAPSYSKLYFNGKSVGPVPATVSYAAPQMSLPALASLQWYSLNSLPELSASYSDAAWTTVNRTSTFNQFRPTTSVVPYADEYGYHSGSLMYRAHFTAPATSLNLSLYTDGGQAYGYSVWLGNTSIMQYPGLSTSQSNNVSIPLTGLKPNQEYVATILIDHMGLTENFNPGNDTMREPRGVLSYNLTSSSSSSTIPISWKITGNLGGEQYMGKTRGPLNEGSMYFERQGYHLPGAPLNDTSIFTPNSSPLTGFSGAGVRFYATEFELDLPTPEYDIPLAFVFTNSSSTAHTGPARYRVQLYVNGWQFGKYVNHIGPQTSYPIPPGIINEHGSNYIGVSLWNMEDGDTLVKLDGLELRSSSTPVMSGYSRNVRLSYSLPQDGWHQRVGAY